MIQRMRWAAYASIGAGVIHAIAVGLHVEHAQAARAFLVLALAQIAWGIGAFFSTDWRLRFAGAAVGTGAVSGWVMTRTSGIAFIDGLQSAEDPQAADTLAVVLACVSLAAVIWASMRGDSPAHHSTGMNAAYACVVVAMLGAWSATGVVHVHGEMELVDGGLSIGADGVIITPSDGAGTTTLLEAVDDDDDDRHIDHCPRSRSDVRPGEGGGIRLATSVRSVRAGEPLGHPGIHPGAGPARTCSHRERKA